MAQKNIRYKELDALRGIAALFVVLFHFTMGRQQAELGFKFGVTGVDLFFMISGFVIFMSINNVSSALDFFINRFSRLFPTYWACVTFTFSIQAFIIIKNAGITHVPFMSYIGNMTMFQYYLGISNLDGPYWTMIIEMLFYILIAIIFSIKQVRNIIPVGLVLLLFSAVYDLWLETYLPSLQKIDMIFPLIIHFPLFFAGIIFYKLLHPGHSFKYKALLYTCLLICYLTKLMLFDDGGGSRYIISLRQYAVIIALYFLLFFLFKNNKLNFIVNRATLHLGKISYALYLVHQYISVNIIIPCLIKYFHFSFMLSALLAIPVIFFLASAINKYIEMPLGKKMRTYMHHRLASHT